MRALFSYQVPYNNNNNKLTRTKYTRNRYLRKLNVIINRHFLKYKNY